MSLQVINNNPFIQTNDSLSKALAYMGKAEESRGDSWFVGKTILILNKDGTFSAVKPGWWTECLAWFGLCNLVTSGEQVTSLDEDRFTTANFTTANLKSLIGAAKPEDKKAISYALSILGREDVINSIKKEQDIEALYSPEDKITRMQQWLIKVAKAKTEKPTGKYQIKLTKNDLADLINASKSLGKTDLNYLAVALNLLGYPDGAAKILNIISSAEEISSNVSITEIQELLLTADDLEYDREEDDKIPKALPFGLPPTLDEAVRQMKEKKKATKRSQPIDPKIPPIALPTTGSPTSIDHNLEEYSFSYREPLKRAYRDPPFPENLPGFGIPMARAPEYNEV